MSVPCVAEQIAEHAVPFDVAKVKARKVEPKRSRFFMEMRGIMIELSYDRAKRAVVHRHHKRKYAARFCRRLNRLGNGRQILRMFKYIERGDDVKLVRKRQMRNAS